MVFPIWQNWIIYVNVQLFFAYYDWGKKVLLDEDRLGTELFSAFSSKLVATSSLQQIFLVLEKWRWYILLFIFLQSWLIFFISVCSRLVRVALYLVACSVKITKLFSTNSSLLFFNLSPKDWRRYILFIWDDEHVHLLWSHIFWPLQPGQHSEQ